LTLYIDAEPKVGLERLDSQWCLVFLQLLWTAVGVLRETAATEQVSGAVGPPSELLRIAEVCLQPEWLNVYLTC